jgi:uracil-DNA glycosylase family 4
MRAALTVLTEELRRLKSAGVKTVTVAPESLARLRAVLTPATAVDPVAAPRPAEAREADPVPATRPRVDSASVATLPTAPAEPALPPPPVVDLPPGDKVAQWAWLREQVTAHPVCRAQVREGCRVVLGVGSLDARIFFCGEAPGAEEEQQGEPFVGPAGQLLDRMIGAMGLKRAEVYIGNIMNWRPPLPSAAGGMQVGNRPPTAEEMAFCLPFLQAQLAIVRPAVIVALGATAAKGLLGAERVTTLGAMRGAWHDFGGVPVRVTYHPSYILRNNTNRSKRAIWEDFLAVMERVELPISDKQRAYFLGRG